MDVFSVIKSNRKFLYLELRYCFAIERFLHKLPRDKNLNLCWDEVRRDCCAFLSLFRSFARLAQRPRLVFATSGNTKWQIGGAKAEGSC